MVVLFRLQRLLALALALSSLAFQISYAHALEEVHEEQARVYRQFMNQRGHFRSVARIFQTEFPDHSGVGDSGDSLFTDTIFYREERFRDHSGIYWTGDEWHPGNKLYKSYTFYHGDHYRSTKREENKYWGPPRTQVIYNDTTGSDGKTRIYSSIVKYDWEGNVTYRCSRVNGIDSV